MPWEVTGPVKERERFIVAYLTGLYTVTELAERFGVSRQKLYKWLSRHNADGMKGLVDHSRAPLHIPHRTDGEVAAQIIAFRRRFPYMVRERSSPDLPSCIRRSSGLPRARRATFCAVQIWSSHASAEPRPHIRYAHAVRRPSPMT